MTLDQLRVFVAVAEREHVTRAAASLSLAQSAVSAAVASLEREYGLRLFDRVGRNILLTEAGRLLLGEARAVLARAGALERTLGELSGLRRGMLTLHASPVIAGYWLPPRLARFHDCFPDIRVELRIGEAGEVARAVAEGAAELGFVEEEVTADALLAEPVAEDWMVPVARRADPGVTVDLRGRRWVMRERGCGARALVEAALRRRGIDPASLHVALELPSDEAVRAAVEAGAGIAALSEQVVAQAVEGGTLRAVGPPLAARSFHVLRHRERPGGHASLALLARLGDRAVAPPLLVEPPVGPRAPA